MQVERERRQNKMLRGISIEATEVVFDGKQED